MAPVIAGSTVIVTLAVTTAAVVLTELVAAWLDRTQPEYGWALLTGAAIVAVPTAGWAAVSSAASVMTLA